LLDSERSKAFPSATLAPLANAGGASHLSSMALIDRSNEPRPEAKKTRSVKTSRVSRNGKFVTMKTVDTESQNLSRDLRYVFTSNVRSVTRKK
jgi:hypothetical protein